MKRFTCNQLQILTSIFLVFLFVFYPVFTSLSTGVAFANTTYSTDDCIGFAKIDNPSFNPSLYSSITCYNENGSIKIDTILITSTTGTSTLNMSTDSSSPDNNQPTTSNYDLYWRDDIVSNNTSATIDPPEDNFEYSESLCWTGDNLSIPLLFPLELVWTPLCEASCIALNSNCKAGFDFNPRVWLCIDSVHSQVNEGFTRITNIISNTDDWQITWTSAAWITSTDQSLFIDLLAACRAGTNDITISLDSFNYFNLIPYLNTPGIVLNPDWTLTIDILKATMAWVTSFLIDKMIDTTGLGIIWGVIGVDFEDCDNSANTSSILKIDIYEDCNIHDVVLIEIDNSACTEDTADTDLCNDTYQDCNAWTWRHDPIDNYPLRMIKSENWGLDYDCTQGYCKATVNNTTYLIIDSEKEKQCWWWVVEITKEVCTANTPRIPSNNFCGEATCDPKPSNDYCWYRSCTPRCMYEKEIIPKTCYGTYWSSYSCDETNYIYCSTASSDCTEKRACTGTDKPLTKADNCWHEVDCVPNALNDYCGQADCTPTADNDYCGETYVAPVVKPPTYYKKHRTSSWCKYMWDWLCNWF